MLHESSRIVVPAPVEPVEDDAHKAYDSCAVNEYASAPPGIDVNESEDVAARVVDSEGLSLQLLLDRKKTLAGENFVARRDLAD